MEELKTSTCRYRHTTCKKANELIARERAERAADGNETEDDDDDYNYTPPTESDAADRSGGPRPPPPPPPPGAASASGKLGGAGNLAGWLIRSH